MDKTSDIEEKLEMISRLFSNTYIEALEFKQQRDDLLEFVQLVKQYFDDYDVSIWSEGGREQHPMSKKAENLLNKIEGGD